MHDFENTLASTSATCRVLISGGCFAFSSSMSAPLASLLPYLPCLWARRFGFQQFILALPPLPFVQLDLEFAQILVKEYQTLSSSIGITSLFMAPSFSSWWNIRFDELLNSCLSITSKRIIYCIFIHKFTLCWLPHFSAGFTSSHSRPTKKLKMVEEKKTISNSWPKKPKLFEDVRNSSNLRRSSHRPAYQFDFSNTIDDPSKLKKWKIPLRIVSKSRPMEKKLQVRMIPRILIVLLMRQRR